MTPKQELIEAISKGTQNWEPTSSLSLEEVIADSVIQFLHSNGVALVEIGELDLALYETFPIQHVRHYKGGHYIKLAQCIRAEDARPGIVYYNRKHNSWYDRLADDFESSLEDGTLRFTPVEEVPIITELKGSLRFTSPPENMPKRTISLYQEKGWKYCSTKGYVIQEVFDAYRDIFGIAGVTYDILDEHGYKGNTSLVFYIGPVAYDRYMKL